MDIATKDYIEKKTIKFVFDEGDKITKLLYYDYDNKEYITLSTLDPDNYAQTNHELAHDLLKNTQFLNDINTKLSNNYRIVLQHSGKLINSTGYGKNLLLHPVYTKFRYAKSIPELTMCFMYTNEIFTEYFSAKLLIIILHGTDSNIRRFDYRIKSLL